MKVLRNCRCDSHSAHACEDAPGARYAFSFDKAAQKDRVGVWSVWFDAPPSVNGRRMWTRSRLQARHAALFVLKVQELEGRAR